jgi:hypothetical protein
MARRGEEERKDTGQSTASPDGRTEHCIAAALARSDGRADAVWKSKQRTGRPKGREQQSTGERAQRRDTHGRTTESLEGAVRRPAKATRASQFEPIDSDDGESQRHDEMAVRSGSRRENAPGTEGTGGTHNVRTDDGTGGDELRTRHTSE